MTCHDIWWFFMTKHVVYHDMSWHVMTNHETTPSDSERQDLNCIVHIHSVGVLKTSEDMYLLYLVHHLNRHTLPGTYSGYFDIQNYLEEYCCSVIVDPPSIHSARYWTQLRMLGRAGRRMWSLKHCHIQVLLCIPRTPTISPCDENAVVLLYWCVRFH